MKERTLRKGQLSIEFLLIFAIFLAVLSFFLSSFTKLKDRTQSEVGVMLMQKYSNDIRNNIDSICTLGEGNVRVMEVYFQEDVSMSFEQGEFKLSSNNYNISFVPKCNVEFSSNTDFTIRSGKIKLENKKGKITIDYYK